MLSIVIPAHNEEKGIAQTVAACRKALEKGAVPQWEIIVVNDGSSDATADMARQAGCRVISHPVALGYGRSIKDGIAATCFDTITIADADATYPVDRIPDLLACFGRGFDMVVGARTGRLAGESLFRRVFRRLLKLLVEFVTGQKIPDINSGLRLFSKSTVVPYLPTLCDGFSFTTSLTLGYLMTGKAVGYVPITYHPREGKSKVRFLRDSLRTLQFVIEAILYYNPIKIFLVLSALVFTAGVLCVAGRLLWNPTVCIIIGAAMIVGSVCLFAMGLLAVLLKQILQTEHANSNGVPGRSPHGLPGAREENG